MAVAQLQIVIPAPCVWRFDGLDSVALDESRDEKPPRVQGVLAAPVGVVIGSAVQESERAQKERQTRAIVTFYRDQGITARDLQRMTSEDLAARVTLGTVRARPDSEIPAGSRGTISRLSGPLRTVDNSAVPNEPPA